MGFLVYGKKPLYNQSHGVGLLDGLNVQPLLPHHRLHLPLQGI
uniref:Uncharacterized protein n=1 Tax=Arundo donax TaxID=35708 RepID=A0A0A9FDQ3_ARUDO